MRISHVSCGIADLDAVEKRFRDTLGLGLWRFPGGVGAHVPLGDHQYVELYGPTHPLWRLGWITWSIAVENLDDDMERLELTDARSFGGDPDRTFTPWRGRLAATTLSHASGGVVPYLIEYDRSVDLDAIFEEKHRAARHDIAVGPVRQIISDGVHITGVAVEIGGLDVSLPLP